MKTAPKIAVLILAAGEASRMQRPKQLLPWKETTLLNHSIETISSLKNTSCYVVLGAYKDDILPTITDSSVSISWFSLIQGSSPHPRLITKYPKLIYHISSTNLIILILSYFLYILIWHQRNSLLI